MVGFRVPGIDEVIIQVNDFFLNLGYVETPKQIERKGGATCSERIFVDTVFLTSNGNRVCGSNIFGIFTPIWGRFPI